MIDAQTGAIGVSPAIVLMQQQQTTVMTVVLPNVLYGQQSVSYDPLAGSHGIDNVRHGVHSHTEPLMRKRIPKAPIIPPNATATRWNVIQAVNGLMPAEDAAALICPEHLTYVTQLRQALGHDFCEASPEVALLYAAE